MNTFGRYFRVSVFGESHGDGIGIVLDGVPAGIVLSENDFEIDIARRKSGARGTTARTEEDRPEILSGVLGEHTTGAPLAIIFRNHDTRSSDYTLFKEIPRPGHADFVAGLKWNDFNDPRGGGHFSGRLTLPITAAGVVAKKILLSDDISRQYVAADKNGCRDSKLKWSGIGIKASLCAVGGVSRHDALARALGGNTAEGSGGCHFSDAELWHPELDKAIEEGDSLGGVVECVITGVPAGLGEPFFDSLESLLSHAVFSIPGVRGIEFGDGFRAAAMKGSEHNDPLVADDGKTSRNGAGGVNGGITNGNPIVFRTAFKPTSSIRKVQHTYNFTKGEVSGLEIPGRHDVCFALRTPVVTEAMAAIVLADLKMFRL